MKTFATFAAIIFSFFFAAGFVAAQDTQNGLEFKIQLLDNANTYGVFVKPNQTIAPSSKTQTGSGQVTLVVPAAFEYNNLKNVSGTWIENARVDGPVEAADKSYVSFGFVVDNPRIQLFPNEETLLFTFTTDASFAGQVELFDNENDPFMTPNSYGTNPGNDLGVIDLGAKGGMAYYAYARNYSTQAEELRNLSTLASK
ncbi:MAG: hypothetical protein IPN76_20150 [Saprospiraceae bacterium]|nr:hypothetical protein [Saprospiraceae bacterium]